MLMRLARRVCTVPPITRLGAEDSMGMTREPSSTAWSISVTACSGVRSPMRTASTARARSDFPESSAARISNWRATPSASVETFTWPTAAAAEATAGRGISQTAGPPEPGASTSWAAATTFPARPMERASAPSSASVVGIGIKDIDGDDFGLRGGDRIKGFRGEGARPGETAEAVDTGLIDGDDGNIVGGWEGSASLHQPVARIALDAGGTPVDQHPDPGGKGNNGDDPDNVAAAFVHFPQLRAIGAPIRRER